MYCPKCGQTLGEKANFCENCGHPIAPQAAPAPEIPVHEVPTAAQKPEKVLTGIFGAILGAILGGAVIILMSRLGYVAALSGLAVAISVLEGYDLFAGHKPAKGLWICLLIMAVTPYLADRIDWAIVLVKEYGDGGLTFWDAFARVPDLIGNIIESKVYTRNLLLTYGFAVLGAFGTLKDFFKKK